jgi:hypothetical protein
MNLTLNMANQDAQKIIELLSIWDLTYTNSDESAITISYKQIPSRNTNPMIIIPSDTPSFYKWCKEISLDTSKTVGMPISVCATQNLNLSFQPNVTYKYAESAIEKNPNIVVLNVDIIKEYTRIIDEALNAKTSFKYRVLTSLPIPYTLAPKELRALIMKDQIRPKKLIWSISCRLMH